MDFISVTFIGFVILLSCIYFIVPDKVKWCVLLAGSYIFYMASSVKALCFLIITTIVTFVCGRILGSINERQKKYLDEHKGELSRSEEGDQIPDIEKEEVGGSRSRSYQSWAFDLSEVF